MEDEGFIWRFLEDVGVEWRILGGSLEVQVAVRDHLISVVIKLEGFNGRASGVPMPPPFVDQSSSRMTGLQMEVCCSTRRNSGG